MISHSGWRTSKTVTTSTSMSANGSSQTATVVDAPARPSRAENASMNESR